nr:unnamed protein product [Digitaria exilis]
MEMPPPPPPPPPPFCGSAGSGGGKPDRKTVERNRRNQMNALYSRLDTLVRSGSSPSSAAAVVRRGAPAMTRPERLEEAAAYIRQTTERVERLKERKRELTAARASSSSLSSAVAAVPEVEVQHLGSGLHAILVTGSAAPASDGASFHRAVRAVEEAGGEVQNAHFSVVVEGGIERVVQRLKAGLRGDV